MLDLNLIFVFLFLVSLFTFLIAAVVIYVFTKFRFRSREAESIDSVLLQISVHKNNEVKIDAMEQLFSSLYAIKKGGWKQNYAVQPAMSFEIVAKKEDIRFYIWTPKEFQDLIEKQVHGAYPDAEVVEVQEYNIFSEEGKVAYKALQLGKENFFPLKTFKDLPTDPLSSLTSALAKMGEGEAAAVQILITPSESSWQKAGSSYVSSTKKQESDPKKQSSQFLQKLLKRLKIRLVRLDLKPQLELWLFQVMRDRPRHILQI